MWDYPHGFPLRTSSEVTVRIVQLEPFPISYIERTEYIRGR
jgi:hypothetical protein